MIDFSVIIPTLNEAENLSTCIAAARAAGADEIIVADGGSTDGTADIASELACLVRAPKGRARQMNAGARQAGGAGLLFLHADTLLPSGGIPAAASTLEDPRVVGGTFRLSFDLSDPLLKFYGWMTRFSCLYLHYGDQAIFLRRSVFESLGGYAELPIMEDIDLLKRVRRTGRLVQLPLAVTTSARRFILRGKIRQELLNIWLVGLYLLGVDPETLKRAYSDR